MDRTVKLTLDGKDVTRKMTFRWEADRLIAEAAHGFAWTPTCFCGNPRTVVAVFEGSIYKCKCGRPWKALFSQYDRYNNVFSTWQTDSREWPDYDAAKHEGQA